MKLKELAEKSQFDELKTADPSIEITGITDNSKNVKEGFIFVAVKGYEHDGNQYIQPAIEKGAALIITENDYSAMQVPTVQVADSRKALGRIAAAFYGFPSQKKMMIGVTGTNGKTTTTFFIKHLLEKHGLSVALVGTVYNEVNGEKVKSINTTPNSAVLHELIASSKDDVVVMEVSSHGLIQNRVEGIEFDYALFTNLQHDHLDYHHTMEEYFQSKALLFDKLKPNGTAIVNGNDEWGKKLSVKLKERGTNTILIGPQSTCEIQVGNMTNSEVEIKTGSDNFVLQSKMPGVHNLQNLTIASAVAHQVGVSFADVSKYMKDFRGIPGRFETFTLKDDVKVVVDFAHTPEAVKACLETVIKNNPERVTSILGFTGKRDESKRVEMLDLACQMSDFSLLTITELNGIPEAEMVETYKAIQRECQAGEKSRIIMDRTLAIKTAVENAQPGEWIVVMGRGHKTYKENFELPTHDDRETILYLQEKQQVNK